MPGEKRLWQFSWPTRLRTRDSLQGVRGKYLITVYCVTNIGKEATEDGVCKAAGIIRFLGAHRTPEEESIISLSFCGLPK